MTIHSAPAKIILFGEHAVVYGEPAIAVPFDTLTATADSQPLPPGSGLLISARDIGGEFHYNEDNVPAENALLVAARLALQALRVPQPDARIELRSTIPLASGFGSGAAIATALIRAVTTAVGKYMDIDMLNGLVYEVEKLHHGTPSGIDNTVIVHHAPVYFVRGQSPQPFAVGSPLTFVIANTGIAASTKETVGAVRALVESDPHTYRPLIAHIGTLVREARQVIERGSAAELGSLMNRNHTWLRDLTVSSRLLDDLCAAALDAGAFGAKLSGGGRGGNLIALVDPAAAAHVEAALRGGGAERTWVMTVR